MNYNFENYNLLYHQLDQRLILKKFLSTAKVRKHQSSYNQVITNQLVYKKYRLLYCIAQSIFYFQFYSSTLNLQQLFLQHYFLNFSLQGSFIFNPSKTSLILFLQFTLLFHKITESWRKWIRRGGLKTWSVCHSRIVYGRAVHYVAPGTHIAPWVFLSGPIGGKIL